MLMQGVMLLLLVCCCFVVVMLLFWWSCVVVLLLLDTRLVALEVAPCFSSSCSVWSRRLVLNRSPLSLSLSVSLSLPLSLCSTKLSFDLKRSRPLSFSWLSKVSLWLKLLSFGQPSFSLPSEATLFGSKAHPLRPLPLAQRLTHWGHSLWLKGLSLRPLNVVCKTPL